MAVETSKDDRIESHVQHRSVHLLWPVLALGPSTLVWLTKLFWPWLEESSVELKFRTLVVDELRDKEPQDTSYEKNEAIRDSNGISNDSSDCPYKHWRNVALEQMYESLNDHDGGIWGGVRDALVFGPKNSCSTIIKVHNSTKMQFFQLDDLVFGCLFSSLLSAYQSPLLVELQEGVHAKQDKDKGLPQTSWLLGGSQNQSGGLGGVFSNGTSGEQKRQSSTELCQHAFFDMITSEKFASLCKILFENFPGVKVDSFFDFNFIHTRMKEGAYEHSPKLFSSDIQQDSHFTTTNITVSSSSNFYYYLTMAFWYSFKSDHRQVSLPTTIVLSCYELSSCLEEKDSGPRTGGPLPTTMVWKKLQRVGTEIVSLAKSLSDMSRSAYRVPFSIEYTLNFVIAKQLDTGESDRHAKAGQAGLYEVCTCPHCGDKADGTNCLVCDSCEEMYHVSCIEPAVEEIPLKSWYCSICVARGIELPHENCVVCERLNASKNLANGVMEDVILSDDETHGELEENPEDEHGKPSGPCKICKNEIDGEAFRVCGHPFCPNKAYHMRCLTSKQLKSYGPHWYCPSCLCRVCLTDKDDNRIVLCDGCDHAYHIYCMNPPRDSIPRGKWFCTRCKEGIQKIRRAKKAYEKREKKRKKKAEAEEKKKEQKKFEMQRQSTGGKLLEKAEGGVDMLLTAAKTLNYEEKLAADHLDVPLPSQERRGTDNHETSLGQTFVTICVE
ncbi:Zinc finger, PHD-finger [Dillenia turbinata]|uniref:Zinc finger, PHD-finger n=1 Tax=Dillenia turbinata TaxID=194707 RepID=A0AAN8ZHP0_9MAGN